MKLPIILSTILTLVAVAAICWVTKQGFKATAAIPGVKPCKYL
jgi:hypothetical protein